MLFSSYPFIFLFVPVTLAGYHLLDRWRRAAALLWLIACSLFFYACWRPVNVFIILPSVAVNYAIIRILLDRGDQAGAWPRLAFWSGIAFNLFFLGYFKYAGFLAQVAGDVSGLALAWNGVILPLGISFITFQKIALLIDVRAGLVKSLTLRDYALFVLFFPQLIAGPIVHYREMMPQFGGSGRGTSAEDFAVGLSLFFGGLFKKVVLADPLAALVNPFWSLAASGGHPALLQSWAAALGYMLQLYFDFSGYSDMATGAARLFGIKLPANFDSPLKATNVIDYWSRWHMTLTRFLTAYVFSPLTYTLMRRRIAAGRWARRGERMSGPSFTSVLAFPTVLTMFLSGLWHGAGYQFLVFGLLHGAALTVVHAWRTWRPRWRPQTGMRADAAALAGWAVTFLFVVCAEVFFRAANVGTGLRVLAGMAGGGGMSLPYVLLPRAAPILAHVGLHATGTDWGGGDFLQLWVAIVLGLCIVLLLPNNLEVLAPYEPALGFKPRGTGQARRLVWSPSAGWALALSGVTTCGVLCLGRLSDFLYWHF